MKGSPGGILGLIKSNPSFVQLSLSSYVVMFPLCLNRDERHAIFNRIGAAFRRG